MIDIINCPACNASSWIVTQKIKDHSISKETFQVKRCSNCSLLITSPQPDLQELGKYYESTDYISHSGKSNNLINALYLTARNYSLKWKLRIINNLSSKGELLDIGCGTGEFLNTAKKNGWRISGVELNNAARKKAEVLLSQNIQVSINEVMGQYNIISLWHVLEHLPDLNEALAKISNVLLEKGKLIIAVPNHNSADAELYKEFWAGYDVPRHLWHFNQKSMVLLLQKFGFKLMHVIPMKLDSYYVSMLSEKYKSNSSGIGNALKGFFTGYKSNSSARKTGEYSSLIYIATK